MAQTFMTIGTCLNPYPIDQNHKKLFFGLGRGSNSRKSKNVFYKKVFILYEAPNSRCTDPNSKIDILSPHAINDMFTNSFEKYHLGSTDTALKR